MTETPLSLGPEEGEDILQRRVLLAYTRLADHRSDWASQLILLPIACELDISLQYAGLILGALSLTVSKNGEALKRELRRGAFDFLVNSRDEALRILKNEARRGRPISVALHAPPALELQELLNRGLAPAMIVSEESLGRSPEAEDQRPVVAAFAEAGATLWPASDQYVGPRAGGSSSALYRFSFEGSEARRRFDERVRRLLQSADEEVPRRWLESAGRVLPRVHPVQRFAMLTRAEAAAAKDCSADFTVADKL